MGKRKERRLAAMIAAGRRVKLDLFAEPSGDVIGTSRNDEVGGDLDQNHRAGVPNSPSSPGQCQENPLMLLGQYSDDELDEEENKVLTEAVQSSPTDHKEMVEDLREADGDKTYNESKDLAASGVKRETMPSDLDPADAVKNPIGDTEKIDDTAPTNLYNEDGSLGQACVLDTSGMQLVGDVVNGWKIVMHEQTNRYYYWNTVTGETSWEVPEVLVQGMEANGKNKISHVVEENGDVSAETYVPGSNLNGQVEVCSNILANDGQRSIDMIAEDKENCEGIEVDTQDEIKGENGELSKAGPVNARTMSSNTAIMNSSSCMQGTVQCDSCSTRQSSFVLSGHGRLTEEHPIALNGEDKSKHPIVPAEDPDTRTIHPVRLMKYGESLLQRLKVFEGSDDCIQELDWRLKFILEIKVRLSDCKALSSYGSSLLPFWWHTEARLKQLELAIDEEDVSRSAKPDVSEMEAAHVSSVGIDDASQQSAGAENEVIQNDKQAAISTVGNAYPASDTNIYDPFPKEVHHNKPAFDVDVKAEPSLSPEPPCSEPIREVTQQVHEDSVSAHLIHKTELQTGEDTDMDVDMEVDDETPVNLTSEDAPHTNPHSPPEQPIHPDMFPSSAECQPPEPVEEFSAPPPPDEEWIPPPPPDNEPIPPPPPDEPSYPPLPSYAEPIPPLPYTEQYNMAYSVPTYDYYASTIPEATNSNYYAPAEAGQLAETQAQSYYEPIANVFPEAASTIVTAAEPVVYYSVPTGAAPPGPVVSTLESGFYSESGTSYHDSTAADQKASGGIAPESGYCPLPSLKVQSDFSTVGSGTEMETIHAASISATSQAVTTTVGNESAVTSVPLGTASAAKNQPKVVRSKKRTIAVVPTLRSNKKVTSLVDKWKAAKEELHGDEEDEPENAYEILEKKRQREIEEWRARQIASGEAQDNANFQPLGGDWRERVKRKRAKSTPEMVQTPPEASLNEKQQPDLIELSKDLPSGWQAYWDESSKQVYYGNAITSETTWTRPAR